MKRKLPLFHAALILVFVGLSFIASGKKAIWRDEAFSYLVSTQSLDQIISSSAADFSPPLFYFLVHLWTQVANQSDILLRILPLMFSLAFILLLLKMKEKLFPDLRPWEQVLYALLAVFNPVNLYFSFELRVYSLMMFLALSSVYLAIQTCKKPQYFWPLALAGANSLMLYSHNLSLIWVGVQYGVFILYSLIKPSKDKVFKRFLASVSVTALIFLPWIGVLLSQSDRIQEDFWISFDPVQSLWELKGLFAINEGRINIPAFIYRRLLLVGGVISLAGMVYWFKKSASMTLIAVTSMMTLIGFYAFSLIIQPVFYWRYLSFLAGPATLLLFSGFLYLKKIGLWVSAAAAVGYLSLTCLPIFDYLQGTTKVEYRRLTEFSKQPLYTMEDIRLLSCMYYHPSCTYVGYLDDTRRYVGITQLHSVRSIPSWEAIDDNEIGIVYQDRMDGEAEQILATKEYRLIEVVDLGDNAYVGRYSR